MQIEVKVFVGTEEGVLRSLLTVIDGQIYRISIDMPADVLDYLSRHLPSPSREDMALYSNLSKGRIILEKRDGNRPLRNSEFERRVPNGR